MCVKLLRNFSLMSLFYRPGFLVRQGEARGLGEEMYEAFKKGEEIPEADVEITDDDPPEVRRMKELIVEMTAYEASDRPTIQQVLAVLAELNSQVRHRGKLQCWEIGFVKHNATFITQNCVLLY